jgi:hypothetical protein
LLQTVIALCAGAAILSACTPSQPDPVVLNSEPLLQHAAWWWQAEGPGRYWLAYYRQDQGLYLRTPAGGTERRMNPQPEGSSTGLAMTLQNGQLYALWRDKSRGKTLQFFRGNVADASLPAPTALDKESEPLTRLKITAVGDNVYTLWLGENDIQYALYFKHSVDGGKTFGETQRVLDGIYPAWVADEQGVSVFSWTQVEGKQHFLMRHYDSAARQFGPTVDIGEATEIPPYLEAFRSGSRLFLLWIGQYGVYQNELKLQGAYSDDSGQSWQRFTIDETPGFDYKDIKVCRDAGQRLYVTYSASPRMRLRDAKTSVYLRTSPDNGSSWGNALRVRQLDDPGTQALAPIIACNKEGEVVVAWEDWRGFRPQVFMNRSADHGATWLPQDVAVGEPRTFISSDSGAALQQAGDRYLMAVERYRDDRFGERDVVSYEVSRRSLASTAPMPANTGDPAALSKRVNAFWEAFEKDDFHTTYGAHDPFFRAQRRYEDYASRLGKIKFHRHAITATRINGNQAEVDMALVYSIPKLKVGQRDYEQPDTEVKLTDRWIYIDGDWYRVYKEESTGVTFVKY